jgi:hypothetical protein
VLQADNSKSRNFVVPFVIICKADGLWCCLVVQVLSFLWWAISCCHFHVMFNTKTRRLTVRSCFKPHLGTM